MKHSVTRVLMAVATLLVLGSVNYGIVAKERIKTQGRVVLLALAPVDPRSLMQGDYLQLRFELAEQIEPDGTNMAALVLDERGVASLNPDKPAGGLRIKYRLRDGRVWLGTNAYFFEEHSAADYSKARFGEFRVDDSGEAVLTGLRDAELRPLG